MKQKEAEKNKIHNLEDEVAELKSIVKQLLEKHAEKPVGMGIAANGGVVELFTSPDGGTWTLIMTMPNGKSVMLGAGQDWATAPVIAAGRKI